MAIRVGFLGVGGIARRHQRYVRQIEDVEIVAHCDLLPDRVETAVYEYGGRGYTNFDEMLANEKLDALFICIPPYAHGEVEIKTANACVHMFIEKPVALSLDVAERIAEAIERAGVLCSVGYMLRYHELIPRIQTEIANGPAMLYVARYYCPMPPGGKMWWHRKSMSGGQTVEQTTHLIDLARYLIGEITEVHAYADMRYYQPTPNNDVEDVTAVMFRFDNGAFGQLSSTTVMERGWHIEVDIILPLRRLEWTGNKLRISNGQTEEVTTQTDWMGEIDRAFIEAVRTGDASHIRSLYRDAMRTLAVTLAVNESAAKGEVVKVSL
ncbi:MAG TPA: Gfo/Idh/MocA family oxidoreductase [Armatimonadetes bacterium]|nr:Gfo/Idh/MocA family oxidoreductase [Armatimonadota bacterium]